MSPNNPIYYKIGIVEKVDLDKGLVTIQSFGEENVAHFQAGGSAFTEIPKVGDYWLYYSTGNAFDLYRKANRSGLSDKIVLHEGDAMIEVPFTVFIRAQSIDMSDEHGYFFDPVTGKLNKDRLPDV